jgi:hypothetical protein
MVIVRGRLEPDVGVLLMQALAAARETLYQRARRAEGAPPAEPSADAPSLAQQQADALALLAETALHHELDPGAPGERYQVVVHVDATALADPEQPGQSVLEDGGGVSRAAAAVSPRATTSATGRKAARPRSPIWRCSAARITGRCTRRVIGSRAGRTTRFGSGGRMAGPCPRCRCRSRCPRIRSARSGRVTTGRACGCTRARDAPAGSGSGWTWAGRSTCCTRWPRDRDPVRHSNRDRHPSAGWLGHPRSPSRCQAFPGKLS